MELSFVVNKPIKMVFDYLTNMNLYASIHPVISEIKHQRGNLYLVEETLKLSFLPFSFSYPVIIESDFETKSIRMYATVFKLTKIEMQFNLTEKENSVIVVEKIIFNSALPFKSIMQKIFKKQHQQFFYNLNALGNAS